MNRALTLGIAGHVDHGKTSMVRALTGVETDVLVEERRRGISIELGFAPLTLDTTEGPIETGLIDMPGHERFVRRMIAGAAGLDAVLLVIAADEGVMPQGREHLAICELLRVRRGAVVLTKVDLADELLLEMVEEDVRDLVAGTCLEGAPVLRFTAKDDGASAQQLRTRLAEVAQGWLSEVEQRRARQQARPFRMSVDRSFSRPGRGTVVTGTAVSGSVAVDEQVEALPGGQQFRVRGVQRHGSPVDRFTGPGRLALNLAAAHVDEVAVGTVLSQPGSLLLSERFDARLTALPYAPKGLNERFRAMIHLGTTQIDAAISRLDGQPWQAGETAYVQVHLDAPLPVAAGQAVVVRGSQVDPRYGQTLAGGVVLHPQAPRHRLRDDAVLEALNQLDEGDERQQLAAMVSLCRWRGADEAELSRWLTCPPTILTKLVKTTLAQGSIRRFGQPPRYLAPAAVEALEERLVAVVTEGHERHPDRAGLDVNELCRQAGDWLDPLMLIAIVQGLVRRGALQQVDAVVSLPGFVAKLLSARPEVIAALVAEVRAGGLATATGSAARPGEPPCPHRRS